ncbi:SEC-C metal-binding domain-containing protein [Mycobacteroides immunogenum]|uniref:YecA family protein n=1 Tax=Mycobacteroides immunogenum TaxID=83262 RepID=UPI0025B749DC|nr:SEC-C metal-binding domain-containing protein [Mycobacteroides immunogenum]WJR32504.1 SEC-C metal-binding domain-containing protein [Mycobacteroides immunogenum]
MVNESAVAAAIGNQRLQRLNEYTNRIADLADSAPSFTESLTHLLLPLKSTGAAAQAREIECLINPDPADEWNYITLGSSDGSKRFAKGSPFMHRMGSLGSEDWMITFTLSEQFMRLGAWWFTQLWRAAELATAARGALLDWNVVTAAACARSLLEGAAYMADELPALASMWDGFKRQGNPSIESLNSFVQELNTRVTTLQYASRIGQSQKQSGRVQSKNVLTYIQKLSRRETATDVMDTYEWLCDAVHPSFGSASTYIAASLRDNANTHVFERYERHPLNTLVTMSQGLHPHVAQNAADAVVLASAILCEDLAEARWVVEDLCLTADIAKALKLKATLAHPMPERNARCPCGSGRKFKRCVHRWGESGMPLGSTDTDGDSD